jgi:IS30 family transposase
MRSINEVIESEREVIEVPGFGPVHVISAQAIAKSLGKSRATVYRYIKKNGLITMNLPGRDGTYVVSKEWKSAQMVSSINTDDSLLSSIKAVASSLASQQDPGVREFTELIEALKGLPLTREDFIT